MTTIDEILTIANQLANEGKQPSVAMVKAKLTQSIPLPTIIKTLKSWQHDPNFTTQLKESKPSHANENNNELALNDTIEKALNEALKPVLSELKEIKALLKQLADK